MFGRPYEITLNRVHDTVRVSENGEHLDLTVNADAMRMVAALAQVQKQLEQYETATDAEKLDAARAFAAAIFGDAQADKLIAFYNNDPGCVVNVCGQYFQGRLSKRITAAQKKGK